MLSFPRSLWPVLLMIFGSLIGGPLGTARAEPAANPVEFNRDIRPILSDACFQCHGPDQAKRKAGLRLDTEEGALAVLKEAPAIVRGDPAGSSLYQRLVASSERKRMPPPSSGRKLTEQQVELIRRWIEQGAPWQKHWSLIPPIRPGLPAIRDRAWPRNPIDFFVLARLEREGLVPSPPADRTTLIRRVTLDLTGLPPTPAEVDAFLTDSSPNAYEKVVDRLLASPRFGERMASRWLDAARYADTSGYQSDGERFMWRWRDWVIDAFNLNMPFDRFTVEQIAGDMLPNATLDQRIASGFNRNHRGNAEGGIIPEEYAVEYVVDRVETTSTVWLGLTMGCARCHEHKFDPVNQKEFYQLFAYFNNVPEHGRAIKFGNSPPMIQAPTRDQQTRLAELERQVQESTAVLNKLEPAIASAQAAWERTLSASQRLQWAPSRDLQAHYPLEGTLAEGVGRAQPGVIRDGQPAYASGRSARPADRAEPERNRKTAEFDGKRFIDAGDVGGFGFYDKFSVAAWIRPSSLQAGAILSRMSDTARASGYEVSFDNGKIQVYLTVRWLDDALRVETERSWDPHRWHHVVVTYDGSRLASGVKIWVDGQPEKLRVLLDELNQTFATKEPFRIGAGGGSRFRGLIGDVRIYRTVLRPDEVASLAAADPVSAIAALPVATRNSRQAHKVRSCFLEEHAPSAIRQAWRKVHELRKLRDEFVESIPTCMVMEEMPRPRDTFVLVRGEYDKRGEKVSPGVPAQLGRLPTGVANNRLGLARWLVDPSNPLPARVTVNRYWQMYFGAGLVRTVDDFGSQGDWPTHPELLDWLATEFMGNADGGWRMADTPSDPQSQTRNPQSRGWDIKALQRTIVLSATYRQSSSLVAAASNSQSTTRLPQGNDPENRFLARGPRYRLPAEMVRDQALAASGLLVEKLGGPSVKPYQPAGLVKELTGTEDYKQDHGEGLYRRSLYTFWKRTVAPPMMVTFDAAGRETCIVRETRTNTPLQALNLMNDVTYVEAARVLAEHVLAEAGPNPAERVTRAFRLVTARRPSKVEQEVLMAGLEHHLERFREDREAALRLASVGEYPRNPRLDVAELAAWTTLVGLLLNLDETVTKE